MTDKQVLKMFKEFNINVDGKPIEEIKRRMEEKSEKRMKFWEGVVDRLGHLLWNAATSAWVFGLYGIMKDTKTPMPDWALWSVFAMSFILFRVLDEVREVKSLLEEKEVK